MQEERQPIRLSPREHELIKFAAEGLTDTAIALRLGISEATVGTYWGRVRIKLGPYNRTELVSIYLQTQQREALEDLRRENERHLGEVQEVLQIHARSRALFEQIIDNAPDGMLIVSDGGAISSANRAAHEMFGYEPGEMNGLDVLDLIPERFREVHEEHRTDYMSHPERRNMGNHLMTAALRKNGEDFLVRASLSATSTSDGLLVTCTIREALND